MAKIVLFGNGPIARSAYYAFVHDSPHEIVGFTVDKEFIEEGTLFDLPVVPFDEVESVFSPDEFQMHIAVGYVKVNRLRSERYFQAKQKGYELANYISSRAIMPAEIELGDNCRIDVNCIISPATHIGNNVFIGAGTCVGHDTHVEDHCYIAACVSIAGSVRIGAYSFLGINVTVRNRVTIARENVIGAGAVMLQDTKDREVYLGTQAELLPVTSDNLPVQ